MSEVARSSARTGWHHTAEAKRLISVEKRIPLTDKLARDREALRLMGEAKTWTYAQTVGCGEQTAKKRLKRLYDSGYADRFKERGSTAWTYVINVKPRGDR